MCEKTLQEEGWRKCPFLIFSSSLTTEGNLKTAQIDSSNEAFPVFFNEVINMFKFPISIRLQEFQPSIEENSKCFPAHHWEVCVAQRRTSTNTKPKKDHFDPNSTGIHSWVFLRGAGLGFSDQRNSSDRYLRSFPGNSLAGPKIETLLVCHHQPETHPWERFRIPDPASCVSLGGLFRCLIGVLSAEGPLFQFNNSVPGLRVEMVSLPCAVTENSWLLPGQLLHPEAGMGDPSWIIRGQQNPSLQVLMSKN